MVKNTIIILLAGCLAAQLLFTQMKKRKVEKQINDLIAYLTLVQDKMDLPELKFFQEGQISILQSEIYKVVVLLREAYSQEALQKRYMADMLSDISHQIKTPISAITIMAEIKGVQLICETDDNICIVCDKHWMTEALLNIAKNSVEHTNEGGTVKVQVVQDIIASHIHVTDDGEGIDSEHLPHIFERFYKADNASVNSVGIGLAMAKQIILKQNGTITVTSEKGKGTDFYVKLFRTDTV